MVNLTTNDEWLFAPPLDVLTQIDTICDKFESQCESLQPGDLRRFVEEVPAEFQGQTFCQLAAIHMELQAGGASPTTSESYVNSIADSWNRDEVMFQLVKNEIQIGQMIGDATPLRDYLVKFPGLPENEIRNVLWREFPVVIQVGSRNQHAFALNRKIMLGRQKTAEPNPISTRELDDGSLKIIVADRQVATVGRTHVELELETDRKVRVTRKTAKSSVEIDGSSLPFDQPCLIEVPRKMRVGPIAAYLRLESGEGVI